MDPHAAAVDFKRFTYGNSPSVDRHARSMDALIPRLPPSPALEITYCSIYGACVTRLSLGKIEMGKTFCSFFRLQHDRQPELQHVNRIHSRNSPVSPMRAARRPRRTTLTLLSHCQRPPSCALLFHSMQYFAFHLRISLTVVSLNTISGRLWESQKRVPSYSGSLCRHAATRVPSEGAELLLQQDIGFAAVDQHHRAPFPASRCWSLAAQQRARARVWTN